LVFNLGAAAAAALVPLDAIAMSQLLPIILTCIPYTAGAVFSWIVAHHSQRRKELWWHVTICLGSAGIAFFLFPVMARFSVAAAFIFLVLIGMFGAAANGPKTVLASKLCAGPAQVVGMPLYNSVSVIGGIMGPFVTGAVVAKYGGFLVVSIIMGSMLCAGSLLVLVLKYPYHARCQRLEQSLGQPGWEGASDMLPVKRNRSGVSPNIEANAVGTAAAGPVSARARTSTSVQQL
jgi:MFS family permease